MSAPGTPETVADGPQVFDRRRQQLFRETVLGDGLLRLAYSAPLRGVSQWLLFRHALWSRLLGWYADCRLSRGRIRRTIAQLGLDETDFRDPVPSFSTFNEFFYRHLRAGARPFDPAPDRLCSPADCRVLVFPRLEDTTCVPVKGRQFTVAGLLGAGRDAVAAGFAAGSLIVCRLCPADYHRFHYPAAGRAVDAWAVPGKLNSVNPRALELGLNVFAENRRAVTLLDLDVFGLCAFVEVGAFGVAGIVQTHPGGPFAKMDEKGYFRFGGSTLVLVFRAGGVAFDDDLCRHSAAGVEVLVRCGETIGHAP
jgi:phosphatidylserine decarboxylase